MSKLPLLGVLVGTLLGGCVPYSQPYRAYGYHHHRGYWRHGYWNRGVYVDGNVYVDPDAVQGAAPPGTVAPQAVPATGAVNPAAAQIAPPGMVPPATP